MIVGSWVGVGSRLEAGLPFGEDRSFRELVVMTS